MALNNMTLTSPPLAPPGAGIPLWERLLIKTALPLMLKPQVNIAQWQNNFQTSRDKLLQAAERFTLHQRRKKFLINRFMGIEDSSRDWSPAQVISHVAIVDAAIANIVPQLAVGQTPSQPVSTADVKPAADVTWDGAIAQLQTATAALQAASQTDLTQSITLAHPWFGPLTAWQWLQFSPIHHGVHLTQLKRMYQKRA